MIRCMEKAREQVLREKGVSVTDAQIERVLSGKNCSLDSSIQCLIRKQGETYTRNLLSAVMEAGFHLKALPVVMMGGGGIGGTPQCQPAGRAVSSDFLAG